MLFIPFSCLTAQAKTSTTMLNKSGKHGHLCLVPDLREKIFSFSPLNSVLLIAVGLLYMTLITLRYIPSMPLC